MNKYNESVKALALPQTFDERVFVADASCPQALCDFILSLALMFNDFKDIVLGHQLVQTVLPESRDPSRELGQAGGISEHLFRMLMAVIHELLVLLDKSRNAMTHPVFQRVVKKLHPEARHAWKTLSSLQVGPNSKSPVAQLVFFARNKVAFHYDVKALAAGYRASFLTEPNKSPYISRALSMAGTRFYFADAAAQRLMRDTANPAIVDDFFSAKLGIFLQINHAIREVVAVFVQLRTEDLRRKRPA